MAKSFDMDQRYPDPSGHLPEQRSKATGGGKSPLDPMGCKMPGLSAPGSLTPSNSPCGCDYGPNSEKLTPKK